MARTRREREMVALWLSVSPMLLAGLEPGVVRALDKRRDESLERRRRIAELTSEAPADPLTRALDSRPLDAGRLSVVSDNGSQNGHFAARRRIEDQVRELNEEIERRVASRTEALAASNQELEAFSYTVSHDLRAPARVVHNFARILAEDHGDELSPQARRHLSVIEQNATQMGLLIDGLLAYARIGGDAVDRSTVDTAQVVRKVVERLRPDIDGRNIELSLRTLPPCLSDPLLLEQVFMNLLANALKFTRGRAPAVVEVDSRSDAETGELVYYVRDNGVGFDMQYADKLFSVFHRLHRAEEFEGTGVGLAIVQRIVQRHGGRVIANSALGEGATIGFTLGAVDEQDLVAATG